MKLSEFRVAKWAADARARSKIIVITASIFSAIACFSVFLHYRTYAFAAIWHLRCGSRMRVANHELTIPAHWWVSKDVSSYKAVELIRAHPAHMIPPTITVAPAAWVAQSTDKKMAATVRRAVAGMQKLESRQRLSPIHNMAEVVIRSPLGNFYCEKSSTKLGRTQIDTNLLCFKAGIPYSFSYGGPSYGVREAESILSTFK